MKYIVTDPCYLVNVLNDEERELFVWHKFVSTSDKVKADEYLSKELNAEIKSVETGFGDWENSLMLDRGWTALISKNFCADSGLVCVSEFTAKMQKIKDIYKLGAVFEADKLTNVSFDTANPHWTVLTINGCFGKHRFRIKSEVKNG